MISILVAFRETGEGWRSTLWRFVRSYLEKEVPDAEIVVSSDDERDPFNKSLALNQAARKASGEVFCIVDADCLVPGEQIRKAADSCSGGWTKPWWKKVKLSRAQTGLILLEGPREWDGRWDQSTPPESVNNFWAAPPIVLPREVYWDVGGMDERYRGWGGEDSAFGHALRKLGYGFARKIRGECLHLWHPREGSTGAFRWPGQAQSLPNRAYDREYNRVRTPEQMRALIGARS